jgi:hypothetical protein
MVAIGLSFLGTDNLLLKKKQNHKQLIQNLFLPLKLIDYQIQRNC